MSYGNNSYQRGRGRGNVNNWRAGRGGGPSGGSSQMGPPRRQQERFGINKGRAKGGLVIDEHIQEACPEDLRIKIDKVFTEFLENSQEDVYIFPSDLNNLQRKYIHWKAQRLNLVSKSHGKEPNRKLHLSKKAKDMSGSSVQLMPCQDILNVISKYDKEHGSVETLTSDFVAVKRNEKVYGRLQDTTPVVPKAPMMRPQVQKSRQNLPIYPKKYIIMDAIDQNQVIVVSSETGSGKTTQIPQYIMEQSTSNGKPVKIICTQPRRISTIAAAERVAYERGESVGASVGYHIRLESKCGYNTSLIYCTVGVFLRNLMCGSNCLKNITHVIVDEIHERDKLSDFLLICLRQNLAQFSHLRIILMSATVNIEKFKEYFQTSTVLSIPGRLHEIQAVFLEDVLRMTGYMSKQMKTAADKLQKKEVEERQYLGLPNTENMEKSGDNVLPDDYESIDEALEAYMNFSDQYDYKIHYEEATADLMQFFISEDIPVDYKHSQRGLTALMIAAHLGDLEFVTKLANMGAKLDISDALGRTAVDYAQLSNKNNMPQYLEYIRQAQGNKTNKVSNESDPQFLGKLYDMTTPDDFIDYELIVHLIKYIFENSNDGSILVFLPGYEEIMQCSDKISYCEELPSNYRIFFLHSSMNMKEQCDVFETLKDTRKIILSTNIAETSITIEDVVFVIDSGKAKEKMYDSYNKMSALQTQWISRACSEQRKGRAGRCRPGLCLRLFSSQRYEHMAEERVPEILRVSLEELCLHAKIIAPSDMNIYNFLSLAPDPPSANSVKVAIESLQSLGALDKEEDLTKLGEYLAQLTVEPKLGKMLIFGCIFRSLEPLLTLAASMAHKDPFQLPPQANLKSLAAEKRRELTGSIQSDHLLYLSVFQKWQQESQTGRSRQFCYNYFISESTMQSVMETRRQLLGQLRATGFVNNSYSIDEFNVNSHNWGLVKAIMSSAFYPNIAYPIQRGLALATRYEKKVSVDNRSACNRKTLDHWLFYDEMVKQRVNFVLRGCTAFTPFMMSIMCGVDPVYPTPSSLNLDDWIEFSFPNMEILRFRKAVHSCIDLALSNPWQYFETLDRPVVNALVKVMSIEETMSGLEQPQGIGVRPIFLYKSNPPRGGSGPPSTTNNEGNWRNTNKNPAAQKYIPPNQRHQNVGRANTNQNNQRHGFQNGPGANLARNQPKNSIQQNQNYYVNPWINNHSQNVTKGNQQQPNMGRNYTAAGPSYQGHGANPQTSKNFDPATALLRGLGVQNYGKNNGDLSYFTDPAQNYTSIMNNNYYTPPTPTPAPSDGSSNNNTTTPQNNEFMATTPRFNAPVFIPSGGRILTPRPILGNGIPFEGVNILSARKEFTLFGNTTPSFTLSGVISTLTSSEGGSTPSLSGVSRREPTLLRCISTPSLATIEPTLSKGTSGGISSPTVSAAYETGTIPSRGISTTPTPSGGATTPIPYAIKKTNQFNDNLSDFRGEVFNFTPFQYYLPLVEVVSSGEGEAPRQNQPRNNQNQQNRGSRVPNQIPVNKPVQPNPSRYGEYQDNPMFFLIRAEQDQNVYIAQSSSRWIFSPQTEKKVLYFAQQGKRIILVYYVRALNNFMGIAELRAFNIGEIHGKPTAAVDFIYTNVVHKTKTRHLLNHYEEERKPISEGVDGAVIPQQVGEELLRIFKEAKRQEMLEKEEIFE